MRRGLLRVYIIGTSAVTRGSSVSTVSGLARKGLDCDDERGMTGELHRIELPQLGETSGRLYGSTDGPGRLFILAHGAGAGQQHPFITRVASALADRGVPVLTFNFLYMEAKRRAPDRAPQLEATWRAVMESAIQSGWADPRQLIIGGKSMGGRIASMVAADPPGAANGSLDKGAGSTRRQAVGLVLLGYPLHPPGQPERPRVEHLPRLRTPTLVVQGTRDAFGTADEVRTAFGVVPAPVDWLVIERGDHSFAVPKSVRSAADVQETIAARVAEWIRSLPCT
jgi:predicted alpha/beta-hydrolase family hydrolase